MLEEFSASIEETLQKICTSPLPQLERFYAAARYLLLAPAKRLRPLLVLTLADHYGVPKEAALYPACALELIHTYSLIHDDLPCMDDDDFRRGQPSLHKAYDEATALLAGDFLLTLAFEVLATAPLPPAQTLTLIKILTKHSSALGMIGGQWLECAHPLTPRAEIYHRKTGALFVAAFEFGATLASLPPPTHAFLSSLGRDIGYLFQLLDDLADGDHPDPPLGTLEAATLQTQITAHLTTLNSPHLNQLLDRLLLKNLV